MMRRREFITLLGGAAAWPRTAQAQQPSMPVIGYLSSTAAASSGELVDAFRQGLKEARFVEGQNVAVEYRFLLRVRGGSRIESLVGGRLP
jgi:putative tryptophan/tyrosine transport system substrate-binding protein